ncbi:MAG: EamA family transporter [Lentisphaeria bacterium]|nr:EamA family transporter [Lentisphaeria bacterium]
MSFGIICGLCTALLNSIGYLLSAAFLKRCNSPVKLLIFAQTWMMIFSLPAVWFLLPENGIADPVRFFSYLVLWVIVFFTGQGAFFMALKYFEASRLSSLLGLKIIVLTVIYMLVKHAVPSGGQILAVLMSAAAAVMINWTGGGSLKNKGWFFVFATLICFSLADISETILVTCMMDSGLPTLHSAFAATLVSYSALGICSLPGLFFFKPDKNFKYSAPYALVWLLSQVALLCCFALVQPVFGNVILASRGIFSVALGALAAWLGLRGLDARISRTQWIRRAFAALLMVLAIALYSWSVNR